MRSSRIGSEPRTTAKRRRDDSVQRIREASRDTDSVGSADVGPTSRAGITIHWKGGVNNSVEVFAKPFGGCLAPKEWTFAGVLYVDRYGEKKN